MRVLISLTVLMLLGCDRTEREPAAVPSPVFDLQVLDLDGDRAVLDFGDAPQPIKLGSGWYDVETTAEGPAAWSSRSSSLYFARPAAGEVDFIAVCRPVDDPDGPPQILTPSLNRKPLPPVALTPGRQTARLPLPRALLKPGINHLEMRFAHAAKPSEISDSGDQRSLAVLFHRLAVAPRHLSEARVFARSDPEIERGRFTLRPGAGALLPLPAGAAATVHLGLLEAHPGGSAMAVDVVAADGSTREIFRGEPAAAALPLAIPPSGPRPPWLRLRWLAEPGTAASAVVDLETTRILPEHPAATERGAERPHVFIYMIDTLRADALEPYGASLPTSPRIAEFAGDAVVFERAWSTSAWTYPATASVLTGSYPFRHGLTQLERQPADPAPTLGEWLGEKGYDSLAISQSYIVNRAYGLDRGFESFYLNDALGKRSLASGNVRWFLWQHLQHRQDPERPLFCYVHTVDPHALYRPRGSDRRFAEASPGRLEPHLYNPNIFMWQQLGQDERELSHLLGLYLGEVLFADRQFGAFLDFLKFHGLYDNSLIALLSDHGEEFYEHLGFAHSRTLYQEMLHVPLIVKFPHGWQAGTRVRARATIVDLAATILDLAGEDPAPLARDGTSLRRLVADPDAFRNRIVFAETRVVAHQDRLAQVDLTAIAAGDVKCIQSANGINQFFEPVPTFRVYDLAADPHEKQPLPPDAGNASRCAEALERWVALAQAERPGSGTAEALDQDARDRLRALGYLD